MATLGMYDKEPVRETASEVAIPDSLRTQVQGVSATLVNIKAMVDLLAGDYPVGKDDEVRSANGAVDELGLMIANLHAQAAEISHRLDSLMGKI